MLGFKVIFKFSNGLKTSLRTKLLWWRAAKPTKTLFIVPLPIIIDECGHFPLQSDPRYKQLTSALNVGDRTFVTKTLETIFELNRILHKI